MATHQSLRPTFGQDAVKTAPEFRMERERPVRLFGVGGLIEGYQAAFSLIFLKKYYTK
jgi:hypothetical protein